MWSINKKINNMNSNEKNKIKISLNQQNKREQIASKVSLDLEGKTLLEVTKISIEKNNSKKDKGGIGKHVEKNYFKISPNNRKEPDLVNEELEIKCTGIIKKIEGFRAKERIKLSAINFNKIIDEIDFYNSTFLEKNRNLLIIFYEYDKNIPMDDWIFKKVSLIDLLSLDEINIIKNDYERIVKKIKDGYAHELSAGDTEILEACTNGSNANDYVSQPNSNKLAKKRAFAFKNSFVSKILYNSASLIKTTIIQKIF